MSFTDLRNRLNASFATAMQEKVLFETDINRDELWALYLDSFPEGTNPLYRVRREFDCSCCRHFLKNIGGTVYIDADMNIRSIFEFDAGSDIFQPVMDALAKYVKENGTIVGRYWSDHSSVGTEHSRELNGTTVKTWNHFYLDLRPGSWYSTAREAPSVPRRASSTQPMTYSRGRWTRSAWKPSTRCWS